MTKLFSKSYYLVKNPYCYTQQDDLIQTAYNKMDKHFGTFLVSKYLYDNWEAQYIETIDNVHYNLLRFNRLKQFKRQIEEVADKEIK